MINRILAVETTTGVIRRKILTPPDQAELQLRPGESLFVIIDDDGLCIDEANVVVSETGEWEASPTAPPDVVLPDRSMEYTGLTLLP